jgi:hypoxanthine phosphoribosyltransferase
VEGKDVLLVDEMCDTGKTLACLVKLMEGRGARSVRTCVLLNKQERREADIKLDYVGMVCPDAFVVGYGMDWGERFRSLRDICVVKPSAYAK